MDTTRRRGRGRPVLVALALLLAAGGAHAGDGDPKPAKRAPHLDFRRTYGEALLEGRVRNVPVFVSRQKDF